MTDFYGFLFIVLLGTLCHFIYEWSGHRPVFALLCAVNESTWEHMKLAFGPAFLWLLIEAPFRGENPNFLPAKAASVAVAGLMIPLFFYAYRAILGYDVLALDIFDFIFAVGLGQLCSYLIMKTAPLPAWATYIALFVLLAVFGAYMLLTLYPPRCFLYTDPITKKTGLEAHQAADLMRNQAGKP